MVREEARDGGLEAGSRHSVWSLEPPGPRSACFWSLRWSRWMYFFASAVSKGSEALPGRWTMAAALATVSSRCHVLSDVISWKRRATHFGLRRHNVGVRTACRARALPRALPRPPERRPAGTTPWRSPSRPRRP